MYIATFDYLKRGLWEGKGLINSYKTANSVDQAEIRRTMFEGAIVLATIAMGHMLSNMMDDDDDSYAVSSWRTRHADCRQSCCSS